MTDEEVDEISEDDLEAAANMYDQLTKCGWDEWARRNAEAAISLGGVKR